MTKRLEQLDVQLRNPQCDKTASFPVFCVFKLCLNCVSAVQLRHFISPAGTDIQQRPRRAKKKEISRCDQSPTESATLTGSFITAVKQLRDGGSEELLVSEEQKMSGGSLLLV